MTREIYMSDSEMSPCGNLIETETVGQRSKTPPAPPPQRRPDKMWPQCPASTRTKCGLNAPRAPGQNVASMARGRPDKMWLQCPAGKHKAFIGFTVTCHCFSYGFGSEIRPAPVGNQIQFWVQRPVVTKFSFGSNARW